MLVQVIYYNYFPSQPIIPTSHFINQQKNHITQSQLKPRHKTALDKGESVGGPTAFKLALFCLQVCRTPLLIQFGSLLLEINVIQKLAGSRVP